MRRRYWRVWLFRSGGGVEDVVRPVLVVLALLVACLRKGKAVGEEQEAKRGQRRQVERSLSSLI